jgi:hypothetical protein
MRCQELSVGQKRRHLMTRRKQVYKGKATFA